MANIQFHTINWKLAEQTEHEGASGTSFWKTHQFDDLRIRVVDLSPGYLADHWCQKGHVVYCVEGEFESELATGEKFTLTKDMTYVVSDNLSSHRSYSKSGAKLLIIDGAFLK